MKRPEKKSLTLRTETVRTLESSELRAVNAGEAAISEAWCYTQRVTCTCPSQTWSGTGRD